MGFGLSKLAAENWETSSLSWVVYIVEGAIWFSLTVSLLVRRFKCVRMLTSIWYVSFFALVSFRNISMIRTNQEIPILDILVWFVTILLLFCASKSICTYIKQKKRPTSISEPLLDEKLEETDKKPSIFSQLIFSWINPLLCMGYSKPLVLEDIPDLFSEDEANIAYQKFVNAWQELTVKNDSKSMGNLVVEALTKVYFKESIYVGILALIKTIATVVSPLVLYAFVNYSNQEKKNLREGLFLVGCMIVVKVVESISQRHWFFYARRTGMRVRSALMVAVYQKQLRLSSIGRRRHSTGEVVNYIAVDAYRMGEFPWWFHSGWTLSLQLFLSIGVLFGVVGYGALPGLVPLLICGLLNMPFAKLLQKCQSEIMVSQDERLRATSEILNNMKVIKLQSWEAKFKQLIESLRESEFNWLQRSQYIRSVGTALYWMSPTMISSVIFLGCVVLNSAPLSADRIFTILATLRTMSEPVRMIPEALSVMIQVMVSLQRINTFLLDDELNEMAALKMRTSENSVAIRAGNFTWEPESSTLTLRDIYLEVKRGQKLAVCGSVGAGKSSLLHAVLKEIPKISGNVDVTGSIAYVSQIAWIQSGTVRENILYGKPMDEERYNKAIKATALDKDISSFSHGDLTEIGQRGINMSGGQKQRIQLARAVYNDADIYLLDDPFSAVDAHTAATLFNDCVMSALKKKTVILVTHQVEFLSEVDKILVMEDGEITQCGSYQELLTVGTAFEQLVNAHNDAISASCFDQTIKTFEGGSCWKREIDHEALDPIQDSSATKESKEEISTSASPAVQLTEEEETEVGDFGWKPFLDYSFVSKGLSPLSLSTFGQAMFVAFQAGSTYWLAFGVRIPNINNFVLIGVYAGVSALSTFFVFLRSFFAAQLGLRASKAFFYGFINSIFKAPILFFDSTPVGRIFTRVSSDLSILDFDIPFATAFVIAGGMETIVMILIMATVTWPVLIVGFLVLVVSKYVQSYYLASAREIIRINGTTKAPVMNYAAETSLGVTTIRAFNMVDRFFQHFLKHVDTDAKLFFYSNAATEWLVLRIETLQNLTVFTASLLLVLLPKGYVAPGLVGLSLSYALALTGTHVFMTRWYCNLANYMISVERIKQFMQIEPEPPAIVDGNRPASSWPYKGRIELQHLKIRYRPNAPLVLKGITCTLKEGTRVGVVGRTGSGKTTLISALFRLVEPESGRILIDGLDICSIGLTDLRTKLSIIPQEPTLFKGSVRTNLDPLGLYSDQEIWEALEKCQLRATISNLPNQLDSSVSDEGQNWSAGQRQLFCLGRVLLKRNRILVLDEATASIDSTTDAILQNIIREEFSQCTVITVAHRVPTVIDSGMVMVLSFGNLIEYDEPAKLMQTNSAFTKLVAEYWSSCRSNSSQKFSHY